MLPFRFILSGRYSNVKPKGSASLAYVCKTLPETELPFQVSVEEAQEYAREEHDVFSAFENWRL